MRKTPHVTDRAFILSELDSDGRANVIRVPDGLIISAESWDDVWEACPEFGVPWRSVRFESLELRGRVIRAWGTHPDMPD